MTRLEHIGQIELEHVQTSQRWAVRDGTIERKVYAAWQGARRFLINRQLPECRSADGKVVGIQSRLSLYPEGADGLDLRQVIDGLVTDPERAEQIFAEDPLRALWQQITEEIQGRLGFPLEPELFSNMLTVAFLGKIKEPELLSMNRALLATFAHSDARGLYHFFTSLRFACDVDCTGMAARARLAMGDIDPQTEKGASALRQITQRILGSAAVANVSQQQNESQGKKNGALRRHVLKVYLDDHEVQGAALDRGLKNNPIVTINGLVPVLTEISWGLRSLDEVIPLKEYSAPDAAPRVGEATVAEIVATSLAYVVGYFLTGEYRFGCRYYESPDAFLAFFSDLLVHFPAIDDLFDIRDALCTAIDERRDAAFSSEINDPSSPLNLALRAIAASNVGIDPDPERVLLLAAQDANGGFSRYSPLYALGTKHGTNLYFGSNEQTTAFALRALCPLDPGRLDVGSDAFIYELEEVIWSAATQASS